jgi:hypothetical protein
MASSTSNLDLISVSQASKEVTANALFNATSPTMLFGRRENTSGLNWYCYGGIMMVDGVLTVLANPSAVVLTASQTNYIEATRAGVVSARLTEFTPGRIPLYTAVTNTTTVTTYTDYRTWVQPNHITSRVSVAVTTADVTLTNAQAACRYLTITGALTGNRAIIVPNDWEGIVYNTNTDTGGPWTTTFKTSAGTGIVVAKTTRAHLFADGTNVVRITADT